MPHTLRFTFGSLLVLMIGHTSMAQPTTKPAGQDFVVTPMRVQQLQGADAYVYAETEVTLATIKQNVDVLMKPMNQARDAGAFQKTGEYVFVYQGIADDMNKPIKMQVGLPVKPGAIPPGNLKLRKLEPVRAATVVYSGPLASLSAAYPQIYQSLFAAGHTPTGEVRESYVYWEGPDSPNNVIILQVAVK